MLPDGCAAIAALWYISMLLLVSISDTVMLPAGADGGQLFVNKQHGALIWGMRLQELHADMAAKNDTWAPLGVVEGPTEPTRLDSIFSSLEEFFLAHDPGMASTLTSFVSPTVGPWVLSCLFMPVDRSVPRRCWFPQLPPCTCPSWPSRVPPCRLGMYAVPPHLQAGMEQPPLQWRFGSTQTSPSWARRL